MSINERKVAEKEIRQTLNIGNIFMRMNGLSFIDELPKTFTEKLKVYSIFGMSFVLILLMVVGQASYTMSLLAGSVSVEELIKGHVHVAGYGVMSFGKLIMVRYKNDAFRRLMTELPDIWPGPAVDEASNHIKRSSLRALRIMQIFYTCWNVFGVWMYNVTPIALGLYHIIRGESPNIGYIFHLYYPFDQKKPVNHVLAYIFELFGGVTSVNAMISADMLFITMASHISMLLRVLQVKIRCIGMQKSREEGLQDNYAKIVDVIKIHQRLISYGNDLESAFTVVNLLNVLLSSVNICCVMFSIVSAGVSDAVYESGWYRCDPRSRRALLVMLQRSQKPLYFTALKFNSITMMTFSSILTTAYSYFTLLYTSFSRDSDNAATSTVE